VGDGAAEEEAMTNPASQILHHVERAVESMTLASNHLALALHTLKTDYAEFAETEGGELLRDRADELRTDLARAAFALGKSTHDLVRHATIRRLGGLGR
jgi:hypothetical protein